MVALPDIDYEVDFDFDVDIDLSAVKKLVSKRGSQYLNEQRNRAGIKRWVDKMLEGGA